MTAHGQQAFQPYSDDLETIEKDEGETARALAETMLSIAYKTYGDSGHATRAVHAKSHGFLKARFEVLDGLAPGFAQGLFQKPSTHDAVVRFSSTPGDILHDSVSTPRGMAIKILNVDGPRIEGSSNSSTQDFVLVNGKQFNAPNARLFLANLKLLAATTDRAEGLKKLVSKTLRGIEAVIEAVGGESATIKSLGGHPETHILGESFFSQLPLRHGDHVAKLAIVPSSPELKQLTGKELDINADPDRLRHAVSEYFRTNSAVWDVQIQLCTDVARMPIEDAASVWDEAESPFVSVGRLVAEPQETWNAELKKAIDDGMGFRPWNCLAAHRPLGGIMRMRKLAYEQSQAFRSERNALPVTEPEHTNS